jgi:hypothetical protein
VVKRKQFELNCGRIGRRGIDQCLGYFLNHDLAKYHVPVYIDAIFLAELDTKSSPLKKASAPANSGSAVRELPSQTPSTTPAPPASEITR